MVKAPEYESLSPSEWERTEREEHDRLYRESLPFDFKDYRIDLEHVIWWQDYCYKPGRRKDRGHRTRRVFELMNLERLEGKRILDVGCGIGQYSVFFALLGATVYGFDISPAGIDVARQMAEANGVSQRCHFSVQNVSAMDYQDEFFDIILFHEVLHHAIKYPNVNEQTLRVLKKGGQVIIADNARGNIFFQIGRFFTMRGKEAKGDVVLTLSDLERFAQGFSKCELELMSLLFMGKRVFEGYLEFPPVRWFLFLVKKTDDALLALFPFLRRYCGECVLVLEK